MSKQEIIKIFGDRKIRSVWDDEAEIWYFSIVDVVAVLTGSKDPLAYWRKLYRRVPFKGILLLEAAHVGRPIETSILTFAEKVLFWYDFSVLFYHF